MAANLTKILNLKANFHKEFKLFSTKKIYANNGGLFKIVNIIKQDAREAMRVFFSVLTKRICLHKTNFLRIYSNIVLKVILNCMNMQIAT